MAESLSGYFNLSFMAGKLQNLFYTQVGTIDYLVNFGIERNFFLFSPIEINNEAFNLYLTDRAIINNIPIVNVRYEQDNYDYNIYYEIKETEKIFTGTF